MSTKEVGLDYYALLEVPRNASQRQLEHAYERLLVCLSPEGLAVYGVLDAQESTVLRAQLEEAYQVLKDPEQRRQYDASLALVAEDPNYGALQDFVYAAASDQITAAPLNSPSKQAGPLATSNSIATPLLVRAAEEKRSTTDSHRVLGMGQSPGVLAVAMAGANRRKQGWQINLSRQDMAKMEFNGSKLRALREAAPASVEEMSDVTKISKRYLLALESDDFAQLPAKVYVQGFLTQYARALGLDGKVVAQSYLASYARHRGEGNS